MEKENKDIPSLSQGWLAHLFTGSSQAVCKRVCTVRAGQGWRRQPASCPHSARRAAWLRGTQGQGKGLPSAHQAISDLTSSCFSGATSEAQSDVSSQGHTDRQANQAPGTLRQVSVSPAHPIHRRRRTSNPVSSKSV